MRLLQPRFLTGLFVGALLAFVAAGVAVRGFRRPTGKPAQPFLLKEGFDFAALRSENVKWRGPAVGERIDLSLLRTSSGSRLSDAIGEEPAILVSINPACPMCKTAIDEMQYIREHVLPLGFHYYAVSFTSLESANNFEDYAKSLGFDPPAFEWAKGAALPSALITNMTAPSHLLVDRNGIVIRVWPGSYSEPEVRQRMGHQIVEDALLITETRRALLYSKENSSAARK
jgi:hypothetical protein